MNSLKNLVRAMVLMSSISAHAGTPSHLRPLVLAALKDSPAVRGAVMQAKRWAGVKKCDRMEIEELTDSVIKAYIVCTNPGSSKEAQDEGARSEAEAQVHIEGVFYGGNKPQFPVYLQIEKIAFAYAG